MLVRETGGIGMLESWTNAQRCMLAVAVMTALAIFMSPLAGKVIK